MWRPLFPTFTALFVFLQLCCVYSSPPVKVRLRSSWPAPNLFLEVLESAYFEAPNTFFPVLDLLTSPDLFTTPLASLSPEAIHDASLRTLLDRGYLSQAGARDTFELSLALHSASPKLEAYYQYYCDRELARTPILKGEFLDECTGSWVDWYGSRICDVNTLRHLVESVTLETSSNITSTFISTEQPKLLPFDHVYPYPPVAFQEPLKTAILYADVASPNFRSLHAYLYFLSRQNPPKVQYIFRYVPPMGAQTAPNHLSGYGVMLDLKKMDYLALDDRKNSRSGHDGATDNNTSGGINDGIETDPVLVALGDKVSIDLTTPLSQEEIAGLAVKSAQLVMSSPDHLQMLMQLSQNFPKYATSVARAIKIEPSLQEELESNSLKVSPGVNSVWLNGMLVTMGDVNPFGLVRLLRKERELIGQLTAGGLGVSQAVDLLTHAALATSQSGYSVLDDMFDSSDRQEEGGVIVWWNDLDKDSRYKGWPSSLQTLLRPVFPGQFYHIRRNLFNTVMTLDLSQRASLEWISAMNNIIQRGLPFRFGVVPLVETEDGVKTARLLYYLINKYGRSKTMGFLTKIQPREDQQRVNFDFVREEYESLIVDAEVPAKSGDEAALSFDAVIGLDREPHDELDRCVEKARLYSKRLGANVKASPKGHAFVNGKHFDVTEDFFRSLQLEVSQQVQHIQEQMYMGDLTEDVDTSVYFYDLPTTAKRRNRHIFPVADAGTSLRIVNLPEVFRRANVEVAASDFVYPDPVDESQISTTVWVIADFDESAGVALLRDSLLSLGRNASFRVGFVHNPSNFTSKITYPTETPSYRLSILSSASVLNRASPPEILAAIVGESELFPNEGQVPLRAEPSLKDILSSRNGEVNGMAYSRFCESSRSVAHELGSVPGERMVLINGRLVGPLEEDEFGPEDFELLVQYEMSKRVGPIVEAYTNVTGQTLEGTTREKFADDITMLSSIISTSQIPDPSQEGLFNAPQRPRNRGYLLLSEKFSSFTFGDNSTATYQFAFLVDPSGERASSWTPLILWLSSLESVYVRVYLNPQLSLEELPLKQFYRYNLQSRLAFDASGNEIISGIEFKDLPPDPIYTLGMDVPPAWLVRPYDSHHDLDNIRLSSFVGADKDLGVEAVFDLDYLVVEGHARNSVTNTPPRGLQLQLTTTNSTPVADTQVVANLGYLQFKLKPGVFEFDIRAGFGRRVYELESVGNEGWNSPAMTRTANDGGREIGGDVITLTSLEGLTLYPRFRKRPGMEEVDVLAEPVSEVPSGLVGRVVSSLSTFIWPDKDVAPKPQADINIFTVASGLLYERFVSIMISSVLRNTKSTVKFWFIENFLSPSFLEFIPHFAKSYGFQYELVTYKWPSWLREQKEKQRIIWGYKILFLDVLFPMDLKKVIFVDADQIVRADLQELVDLDLHGAPYGYTPMGDDNTDMEGFRFWKTGYWKDFLRGKPYHISALYVVDLVRFRQLAAGDRLRGHYQSLSADPNSLSNLDQDLPNNLQHEVPIFSLHEDWLWCETWCSKDRLHRAKTIDLCQNPLTKEPKLSRARQIPEWEDYDAEIAQFARKLAEEGLIRSGAYTSGADELANLGASVATAGEADGQSKEADGQSKEADGQSKKDEKAEVQHESESEEIPPHRDEL